MNSFIEKLDSYQLVTNLLPGAFWGIAIKFFLGISLPVENIGEEILVYYFMGFVINRIGSLFVQPILRKLRFIKEAPYPEYLKAAKVDEKINTLSTTNNFFRSTLTCFILLPIVKLLQVLIEYVGLIEKCWKGCSIVFLIILFTLAYRKQTDIVRIRSEVVNCQLRKEEESNKAVINSGDNHE